MCSYKLRGAKLHHASPLPKKHFLVQQTPDFLDVLDNNYVITIA